MEFDLNIFPLRVHLQSEMFGPKERYQVMRERRDHQTR